MLGESLGIADELIEIDGAGGDEAQIVRCVAGCVVFSHGLGGEFRNRFFGTEDTCSEGMASEEFFGESLHCTVGWLVVVHRYFLEDDLFFGDEVIFAEGRPHHIGEEIEGVKLVLGEDADVVDGLFFAGVSVGLGAEFIEFAVYIDGGASMGPFEHHVFEEVANAGDIGSFITGAGFYEVSEREAEGFRIDFGDDFQAVVEGVVKEVQVR